MIQNKKVFHTSVLFIILFLIIFTVLYYYVPYKTNKNNLIVEFIDTGKSDSIFIRLPDSKNVLIDGGLKSSLPKIHDTLHKYRVREIDFLIATHQHDDHIGSFTDILKIYDVKGIYMPSSPIKNGQLTNLENKIKEKNIPLYFSESGDVLINEDDVILKAIAPFSKYKYDDENNYSLVLYLFHNKNTFLFMGDATKKMEGLLMKYYNDEIKKADVIKLGHHGSDTSSSYSFLEKINPRYAVATTDDNEENELSDKLLGTLNKLGIKLFSTNKNGNITFISNGESINIKTEK